MSDPEYYEILRVRSQWTQNEQQAAHSVLLPCSIDCFYRLF